jgi:hypothetical protein
MYRIVWDTAVGYIFGLVTLHFSVEDWDLFRQMLGKKVWNIYEELSDNFYKCYTSMA